MLKKSKQLGSFQNLVAPVLKRGEVLNIESLCRVDVRQQIYIILLLLIGLIISIVRCSIPPPTRRSNPIHPPTYRWMVKWLYVDWDGEELINLVNNQSISVTPVQLNWTPNWTLLQAEILLEQVTSDFKRYGGLVLCPLVLQCNVVLS